MRLYGQLDQRRVYIGAGADVLDQPLDSKRRLNPTFPVGA